MTGLQQQKQESDYAFLARMGRTRVRPGGKRATEWLLSKADFTASTRVLEVACGTGTTSIDIARAYGCHVEAVDLDENALAVARKRAQEAGLAEKIAFQQATAMALPFADESFDVLINEGMLTVLPPAGKAKCIQEYLRVLKPDGVLLTQDICRKQGGAQAETGLLTAEDWQALMQEQGLKDIKILRGELLLMNLDAIVADEGWQQTARILQKAVQPENIARWQEIYNTFQKARQTEGFIAMASHK